MSEPNEMYIWIDPEGDFRCTERWDVAKHLPYDVSTFVRKDLDTEAGAKALAACFDFPWEYMPEQGRASMRKHLQTILDAALGK
ncbi:hypothetical protein D3C75_1019650 [compost metagenome]